MTAKAVFASNGFGEMRRIFFVLILGSVVMSFAVPSASLAAQDDVETGQLSDLEKIMWELVVTTEELYHVEAFIESFPDSQNIEEAHEMAARLRQRENVLNMEDSIFEALGNVTYSSPLAFGDSHLIGRTLPEVIQSKPAYPPIEGLPEELWKDQNCSSCHEWTREALCSQATTYVAKDPDKYRNKPHPFGGLLKINLRNWAQNGCN